MENTNIENKDSETTCFGGHKCNVCNKKLYTHTTIESIVSLVVMVVIMSSMVSLLFWLAPDSSCYTKTLMSESGQTQVWKNVNIECPNK